MITELINKIKSYFNDKPVVNAFLFGSRANGNEKEDSDYDILVELDYSLPIGLKIIEMQSELEEILGKKVDLITSNSVSKFIRPVIDKQKILIYAR
jgi:uncharacterized protein